MQQSNASRPVGTGAVRFCAAPQWTQWQLCGPERRPWATLGCRLGDTWTVGAPPAELPRAARHPAASQGAGRRHWASPSPSPNLSPCSSHLSKADRHLPPSSGSSDSGTPLSRPADTERTPHSRHWPPIDRATLKPSSAATPSTDRRPRRTDKSGGRATVGAGRRRAADLTGSAADLSSPGGVRGADVSCGRCQQGAAGGGRRRCECVCVCGAAAAVASVPLRRPGADQRRPPPINTSRRAPPPPLCPPPSARRRRRRQTVAAAAAVSHLRQATVLVFHSAPAGTKWLRCNSLVDCIRVNRGYIRLPDLLIQLRNIVGFRYGALAELRFVPTLIHVCILFGWEG